jgi:6-phosphogluconolactonase
LNITDYNIITEIEIGLCNSALKSRYKTLRYKGLVGGMIMNNGKSIVQEQSILQSNEVYMYVGSYNNKETPGIYQMAFNTNSGAMRLLENISDAFNPSFLAVDNENNKLYAVSEHAVGSLLSYDIDKVSKSLRRLNEQMTLGADPCHVTYDNTKKIIITTNYSGGSISVYPIASDGAIGNLSQHLTYSGHGICPDRQEMAHPHSTWISLSNKWLFMNNLGEDKIYIYQLDATNAKLTLHDTVEVRPGAGPRHSVFHPNGHYFYVINELNNTITVYNFNDNNGSIAYSQTVSTLPDTFKGNSICADIHVTPDGKFLYGSNRGHDSIAMYAIGSNGLLNTIGFKSTNGEIPRNFSIDPSGKFLIAANQETNNIVSFKINPISGELNETGHEIQVPSKPVCIKF